MGADTKIQWCDHSASPWYGCEHALLPDGAEHPGCANCYAETMSKRNPGTLGEWGADGVRVRSKSFLANCYAWNKKAKAEGRIASVFPSLCDPFEDRPELEPWRLDMFTMIDACTNLRFLLLTKRPQNVRKMWPPARVVDHTAWNGTLAGYWHEAAKARHRRNVWLITSVSDQATADAMIPELMKCRELCPVLGVSAEPLLGSVNLRPWLPTMYRIRVSSGESLNLVIVGGESGPHARPCEVDWIRDLRDQCRDTGTACFVKQLGSHVLDSVTVADDRISRRVQLRDSKGGDASCGSYSIE